MNTTPLARLKDRKFSDADPVVLTVCVPTYQQAQFLPQTVESILDQKTNFRIEIVLSDDGSSDKTPVICQKYFDEFPEVIRFIPRRRETWKRHRKESAFTENAFFCLSQCRGEFGAVCEGDDYWTQDDKLQRQVDHLRRHPEVVGCFHDATIVDETGGLIREWKHESFLEDWNLPPVPSDEFAAYSQGEVLGRLISNYHTAALVFRTAALPIESPPFWLRHHMCDFFLDLALTESGVLHYLPFTASAYRLNKGGSWSQAKAIRQTLEFIYRYRMLTDDDALCARYGGILEERTVYFEKRLQEEQRRDAMARMPWFIQSLFNRFSSPSLALMLASYLFLTC